MSSVPKRTNSLSGRTNLAAVIARITAQKETLVTTREEQIVSVLDRMLTNIGTDALGAMVVGTDGMVLAARLRATVNSEQVGAIAAMILGVTRRVSWDLKQAQLEETIVRSDKGFLLVWPVNTDSLLVLDLGQDANLGMARLEARWVTAALRQLLVIQLQEAQLGA